MFDLAFNGLEPGSSDEALFVEVLSEFSEINQNIILREVKEKEKLFELEGGTANQGFNYIEELYKSILLQIQDFVFGLGNNEVYNWFVDLEESLLITNGSNTTFILERGDKIVFQDKLLALGYKKGTNEFLDFFLKHA